MRLIPLQAIVCRPPAPGSRLGYIGAQVLVRLGIVCTLLTGHPQTTSRRLLHRLLMTP